MRTIIAAIALALLTLAAPAQADDAGYCKALAEKYEAYVNNMVGRSPQLDSVDGRVALEQCKRGDVSAIPVLEQKLRNARIDLPPRG